MAATVPAVRGVQERLALPERANAEVQACRRPRPARRCAGRAALKNRWLLDRKRFLGQFICPSSCHTLLPVDVGLTWGLRWPCSAMSRRVPLGMSESNNALAEVDEILVDPCPQASLPEGPNPAIN